MNISFQLTEDQIRTRRKTVTRRLGWKNLKRGAVLRACVKCMGLKKGESPEFITQIRVVHVMREPLYRITAHDCVAEGFPTMQPEEFVAMFCRHMKCKPDTEVTRIEFEYPECGTTFEYL